MSAPAPLPVKTPIRVLVVDDNEDHAQLANEFLSLSGPFVVDTAGDIEDLWKHLAQTAYDVLLLDYDLPDGNGLDALAELGTRGHPVPVVMVTGHGDERIAAQAIQRGATDYLVKNGDYLRMLPALAEKAVRTHQLMLSAQRSLEQIRYQALLLDNVRDAVVVWNTDDRLTFWNHAAEELYGWRAEERLGRPASSYWATFAPPLEPDHLQTPAIDVERQFRHPAGETVWLSSNITALRNADGHLLGYMDVARDITARKKLEAQIQAAQTQLAQAARLAAIGELASGVAHQISNPLTTVIGEAQILLRALGPDHPARDSAEAIERGGWRAQEAVQRLLEFSRPASATFETLSVNETLQHALALIGAQIETTGITLHMELAPVLPSVHGNARQLEDLWVNLLLMARDAADDGRPHRITLRSMAAPVDAVQVEMNDDGKLIPPEQLASIFEPVFTGSTIGRGTGLELSICREIVRQHHGQIKVASRRQNGTTFTIRLPAKPTETQ